jgi:hypothetical protein
VKFHLLFPLGLLSSSLCACALDTQPVALDGDLDQVDADLSDAPSEKSPEFLYEQDVLWSGNSVSICWHSANNVDATEKAWVRSAVENAIEGYVNFDFTYWGDCATNFADIQIGVGNHEWPWARYGDQWFSPNADMRLNFFQGAARDLNGDGNSDFTDCWSDSPAGGQPSTGDSGARSWFTNRQRCVEVIAVHEFMHALGLQHEQQSPLNNTSFCSNAGDGWGDSTYGYWDLVSVTNYCNPLWSGDGMLSPLDVSGLGMLYGMDSDDQLWYGIGNVADYRSAPADGFVFRMTNYNISGPATPFVGDFNGDARSDIFFYAPGAGQDFIYFGNTAGNGFLVGNVTQSAAPLAATADFDGDGRDDVVWHTPSSGQNSLWFGRADKTFDTVSAQAMPGQYKHKPYAGDFDGDGRGDIFWYGESNNTEQLWYGRADRTFDVITYSLASGASPIIGDFDGDGRSDIYLYTAGTTTDTMRYGTLNRGSFVVHDVAMDDTAVATVADLDGNGTSDILWSYPHETDAIWLFSTTRGQKRSVPTSSILGNSNGNAKPLGGDFNADGIGDVFWYSR